MDYKKAEFFGSHYDLKDDQFCFLFVRNQIRRFDNFNSLQGEPDLYSKTLEFVSGVVNSVTVPLRNVGEIGDLLQEHKIIGLYLGN